MVRFWEIQFTKFLVQWQAPLNFGLARDQVLLFETRQIREPAGVKQTISSQLFVYFRVGRYIKTLNDWSCEKRRALTVTISLALGPVIKCLIVYINKWQLIPPWVLPVIHRS